MRALVLSFALGFSGAAVAADSYLCISDQSTGFAFNKDTGQWKPANFTAGKKYVLSRDGKGWVLKEFGQANPVLRCPNDFNPSHYLGCDDGSMQFRMNSRILRYELAYLLGYYVDYNELDSSLAKIPGATLLHEGDDNPAIEIGKCSPLQ